MVDITEKIDQWMCERSVLIDNIVFVVCVAGVISLVILAVVKT